MLLLKNTKSFGLFFEKKIPEDDLTSVYNEKSFLRDFPRSRGILFIDECPIEEFIDYEYSISWNEEEKKIQSDIFFKKLFEKFKVDDQHKKYYEKFIRLFLHQYQFSLSNDYLASQTNTKGQFFLGQSVYVSNFSLSSRAKITLKLDDSGIYIKQQHFYNKLMTENLEVIHEVDHVKDFLVHFESEYKIEIFPTDSREWTANYRMVSSAIQCKDEFKDIIDSRSIFEKFITSLVEVIEKLLIRIGLSKSNNTDSVNNAVSLISKDGETLDSIVPSTSNINLICQKR